MNVLICYKTTDDDATPFAIYKAPVGISEEKALERAFFHTQNLDGSWSDKKGEVMPIRENRDLSDTIHLIKPLEEYEGQKYGHRSSMVGDMFVVADGDEMKVYVCASFGWDKVGTI